MVARLDSILQLLDLRLHLLRRSEKERYVDPNLDPVLLVPGIGGSVLHAVDENGRQERVWVRLLAADREFRTKLWSLFDPSTGKTTSLDPKTEIVVPEDNYGLYACDTLDPDMILGGEAVWYFRELIEEMMKWGFLEGKTLFGFGYDFRQSNRLQETLDRFGEKLEAVYTASGGKKMNIISHSMGGLLIKCFIHQHSEVFEKYVKGWITIATPFQGAPGYITSSLLSGMSFVNGWQANLFVSRWSMHQLLIECPSMYELMAAPDFNWSVRPLLQVWRENKDTSGQMSAMMESYGPGKTASIMKEALKANQVRYGGLNIPMPFNLDILSWTEETRKILSSVVLPPSVKFFNIYGSCIDTPHNVRYGSEKRPIKALKELLDYEPSYDCVDGDGTVPAESAYADGLVAEARIAVAADHRGIVANHHVFRIVKHWLKAGEPDPYYNPINDYVILPLAPAEDGCKDTGFTIKVSNEQWEILSDHDNVGEEVEGEAFTTTISISSKEGKFPHAIECSATVIHPNAEGNKHLDIAAASLAVSGSA